MLDSTNMAMVTQRPEQPYACCHDVESIAGFAGTRSHPHSYGRLLLRSLTRNATHNTLQATEQNGGPPPEICAICPM